MVNPSIWEMRDILTTLEGYEKQVTILHNQLQAVEFLSVINKKAKQSEEKMMRSMGKETF